ncbi:DEAD/DEAH box helicase family protein [Petrotoga sp. 9PW.55.5.1]|uniref:DEAD/DEAH box helicase family protein n=1 Tax=Petrotoga sp. 9PW.55.5.1 TaxID=1308979 RepID=UPI000DDA4E15|nr:DEAD/DEAH box helicase family protein [Petrotoga sp. 9PW.55.5.1]
MTKLYLQKIIDDISFETLPITWQGFDFARFSKDKTLFDFQQNALKNALRGLWLYFKGNTPSLRDTPLQEDPNPTGANFEGNELKQSLFNHYKLNGFEENFDYDLKKKKDSKTAKYLLQYDEDYPVRDSKISFSHFINRMSFWMATGSGKTLIIVKLIELLGLLISKGEIPKNGILFLAHREDLLEQFKNHVDEFNSFNFDTKINLKNLRDYESVKHENALPFAKNEITVFYYRSDLISDEKKEKIVNFKNYDNSGKWYILLDEAHKGDKEDSKRQILYSILSRNGFLFNFSATFTDPRDFATCAFNFNLSRFVEEGYGKHIYVSGQDIKAFKEKTDFSEQEKQKIVLKTLLLLTYINKYFEKIRKVVNTLSASADTPLKEGNLYHRPLLLTLVNSVSVEDSDLELFFRELEKVAKNEIRSDLIKEAREELGQEFRNDAKFEFEDLKFDIDTDLISKLEYKDILKYVFNAETPGKIEVLKIPGNRQELIFRLMTADKPFALIKIGDISGWLKDKLEGYEINESFENESYFRRINHDDSDINILMGSRSFYEGWDSNRPNILLFVNIGVGSDAKKFVLQSVGRGIRIEPQKYQRKRLQNLFNAGKVNVQLFEKVKNLILPIESLFVFGTNAENLKEIIKTLKEEKQDKNLGEEFILNPEADKHLLLIPVYKTAERIFAEEQNPQKYPISREDFDITSQFYEFLGDKITLAKYDCEVKVLDKAKESFSVKNKNRYYTLGKDEPSLFEPELILERIFDYLGVKSKEFEKFKELENEIVHFKHVKFIDSEKYEEIKKKIDVMKHYPEMKKELDESYGKVSPDKYAEQLKLFEEAGKYEVKNQKIKIKYLANHYYLPVIVSETEKIDYLNHIINVDSEVRFIEELEEYLAKPNNVFTKFDWWMFSKLDQTLDEVFIPYYNPKENKISKFKPDFIFWMQKDNQYLILFVDPKGTEHADGYRKIDGYSSIFEYGAQKQSRDFSYNGFVINTKLLLKPRRGIADVLENYRKYWFDNFDDFASKIS